MCIVSNVLDAGQQVWWTAPQQQQSMYSHTVERVPTPAEWAEFMELVEKARKFDELTGQPNCEDPEKTVWMRDIEARLAMLEAE